MDKIDAEMGTSTEEAADSLSSTTGDILVLGAGGKMGLHLCLQIRNALRRDGQQRKLLAVSRFRTMRSREQFEECGIRTQACDLSEAEQVNSLPEAGAIFYLAGVKFGTSSSPELLQRMNVEAPLGVTRRYTGTPIVALSTGCVYPFVLIGSTGSVETDDPDPVADYAKSCLGREKAFIESSMKHGTPVSIIRLNYATEYRYGVLVDVAKKVFEEEAINLRTGYLNAIWQSDAIDAVIRSLPLASSPPFILNVTGPSTISVRKLAEDFGRIFQKQVHFEEREDDTAWLSNSRKYRELMGEPAVGYEEMVRRTAAWIQSGGSTYGKPTRYEQRDGKF